MKAWDPWSPFKGSRHNGDNGKLPTNIYIEREGKISRAVVASGITIISFRLSIRSFPHWGGELMRARLWWMPGCLTDPG